MTAVVGFLLFVAGFVVRDMIALREERESIRLDAEALHREIAAQKAAASEWQGICPPSVPEPIYGTQSPESVIYYHCTPERLLNMAGMMREVSE